MGFSAADWPLVLRGGTVIDGSGGPRRQADVGIEGEKIAEIAPGLRGEEEIDCQGLMVCPGFLDTHSHSDLFAMAEPLLEMKLRQGITLEVLGQDGISVAPLRPTDVATTRRSLAGLDGDPAGVAWDWSSVAEYLDALGRARPAPDLAYLVPHGTLRTFVMGGEDREPTEAEMGAMERELDTALAQGGIGLSTGLIYPPCCYAQPPELARLAAVSARHGGPVVVHLRSESDYIEDALEEMIQVCRIGGAPLHVSHFKIAGKDNFSKADALLQKIESARGGGMSVTADQYPYAAGSTMLGAILPPWVHAGGPDSAVERLGHPEARRRMRREILDPSPSLWDNFWKWTGAEGIVLPDIPSGRRPELIGLTLKDAAGDSDPLEFALDLLKDEALGVGMITHSQSEAVMEGFFAQPWVNACTDGLLGGRPHPRAYGSMPRILGRLVREKGLLSWEEAIRKLTSQAARAMNLPHVGVLAPGWRANLVAFDPTTVTDTATFADPRQHPKGIEHVMVRGRLAIRWGEPTGIRSGRVVPRQIVRMT